MYDVAIVGSGFGGSLLALILARAGRSVALIEKGRHPRFAIGESSTPIANLLLEELSDRYGLTEIRPLSKWGTWQKAHPEIGCGLKRGFTFYSHPFGKPRDSFSRDEQLLVAASPADEIADTHWYRQDFDHFLLKQAQAAGVDYFDQTQLNAVEETADGIEVSNENLRFKANFLIDASGPRGFLHKTLNLPEVELPEFPRTRSLYTHFRNVEKFKIASGGEPPYPVDDAALHHVFEDGWIWVLRFNNGITSAGVAATNEAADRLALRDGAAGWQRLMDGLPAVGRQFANAVPIREFVYAEKASFLSGAIAGKRWAMLPFAAGFVDPLLSTGIPLTLLGVSRLAEILLNDGGFEEYAAQTRKEILAAARLIGALYSTMTDFSLFTSLTLLYFAAVSFSETARRLDRRELASSFLLCDDPKFGPEFDRLCRHPDAGEIIRAIAPYNVAGLGDPARRNWYPVKAEDLINGAHKFGASEEAVVRLLERCGFAPHRSA